MFTKNITQRIFGISFIISALLVILIYSSTEIVSNKGFNGSDDGAVIAQSFRIVNGEIPHADFISLRPVLSGYFHTIHFISPFPLVESGRIFTLAEIFVFSFLWIFILFSCLKIPEKFNFITTLLFICTSVVLTFVLNLSNCFLFPWTTTDGIMLSTIACSFFLMAEKTSIPTRKHLHYALCLIFSALASLTKQNFLLVTLFFFTAVFFEYVRKKYFIKLFSITVIGLLPYQLYAIYLLSHGAFADFITQMSGQTAFIETGIYNIAKSFVKDPLLFLHAAAFLVLFTLWWKKFINKSENLYKNLTCIFLLVYCVFCIKVIYETFSKNVDFYTKPFELFWIAFFILNFGLVQLKSSFSNKILLIFVIVLSWSSSISVGLNSPYMTMGFLASFSLFVSLKFLSENLAFTKGIMHTPWFVYALSIFTFIILLHSITAQRKYNYRDLPADKLSKNLGTLFPEMGSINTNVNTFSYFQDFLRLYHSKLDMKDRFVLLPNNAFIYPVLKSRNPFPLDWMQKAEYQGSEEKLLEMIKNAMKKEILFLVVDKYDSKSIAEGFTEKKYSTEEYFYMKYLLENAQEIKSESKYFKVYVSSQ